MRRHVCAILLAAAAAPAAAQGSAACREDLANVDGSFTETLRRLEAAADAGDEAKCAAWRQHVEVMAAAREVFERCLAGFARAENVGQLNVSISDFLVVIDARCPAG